MILRLGLIICFGVGYTFFSYNLLKIDILPFKYLLCYFIISVILFLILFYFLFNKKKKWLKIISVIIMLFLSVGSFLGGQFLLNTYQFLENFEVNYDKLTFSVVVLNNKNYYDLKDLEGKKLVYLDEDYKQEIKDKLFSNIMYEELLNSELGTIADLLLEEKVDAIVLDQSHLELLQEEILNFSDLTKVIYTFEINLLSHKENTENQINVVTEPFIAYISGIDQYGNVNNVRGRSDVNQVVVVNPKTYHILLLNTPRDYYVQLADTKGLKDKLTHSGIYGIEKSIKTLENFYDLNINYYLRVNFNSLIRVVDAIGGIDIESDKAFKPHADSSVYIEKGWNHFNGRQALAYARERKSYINGDHHRGANQQQVITAIINKVTNSKVLISKYNSILESLNGSFQTDMPMEEITSFIKYQIDKMPSWNIESIAVTGTGDMQPTYSMGSKLKLYVMKPNMDSVNKAKQKIQEVLNEE